MVCNVHDLMRRAKNCENTQNFHKTYGPLVFLTNMYTNIIKYIHYWIEIFLTCDLDDILKIK